MGRAGAVVLLPDWRSRLIDLREEHIASGNRGVYRPE